MATVRKRGVGTWNIIRFNWHFYAAAATGLLALGLLAWSSTVLRPYAYLLMGALAVPTLVSLAVSYYVYDCSNLYSFKWLNREELSNSRLLVNIHAGFDETSPLLREQFEWADLRVLDFYYPAEHTEVSIRRARAAYPSFPGTEPVRPHALPLVDGCTDWVFVLLAAHEIRQPAQRAAFFAELHRVLRPCGKLVVVEHLRDPANFLAYTIGFLHFYSRASWQQTFRQANLSLEKEQKITPFVSAFILQKDGNPA